MSDLMERLRVHERDDCWGDGGCYTGAMVGEAADLIESQQAEIAKLEGKTRIMGEFLRSRQCPDHSGKWKRGDCLQCEIERLTKIAKAADLVSSMSSYDEDQDAIDPCHMVYFEELENLLIPWRKALAALEEG